MRVSACGSRPLGHGALRIGALDTRRLGAGNVLQRRPLQLRIRAVLQTVWTLEHLRTLHLPLWSFHALQALRLEALSQRIALGLRQFPELPLNVAQALLLPLRHIVELAETLLDLFALIGTELLEIVLLLTCLVALFRRHLLPARRATTQALLLFGAQRLPAGLHLLQQLLLGR